jgi:quinoprotein relay system zinc metallohydrolase 2
MQKLGIATTMSQVLSFMEASAGRAADRLQLEKVADGVFAFRGAHALMTPSNQGAICNLGIITGREAVAVIDSGGSLIEARALLAAIGDVTDKPVRYLINTHMHPDHVFGNAIFRDAGATIVGHRNLPRALEARGETYLHNFTRDLGAAIMKGVEIIPPQTLVDDRLLLDLGDRAIELRAWKPAHTDNDVTVLDAATKTLFTGDLTFIGHVPTLDGSLLGWMGQLSELAGISAVQCVPGHGPVPAPWPSALDAETRYFDALARDIRKSISDGQKMGDAVKTAAEIERRNWSLFDEYNERNAAAAFAELEWE